VPRPIRAVTVDFWGTLVFEGPRADDRYRRTPENIRIARTAEIERARWIVDLP